MATEVVPNSSLGFRHYQVVAPLVPLLVSAWAS